jgi:hypothetical protein
MVFTYSRTSRRPVMHRAGRNYFQRLRFLPRRLKIAGPAQQAVEFVGRDHGQPDQHGAIAAKMVFRYEGVDLPYRTFDKIRQVKQTAIVENKRLGSLLVPETVQHVLKGLSTNKT